MSDCVTCGGPYVALIPEHRESDECSRCRRGYAKTATTSVAYQCSECGTGYRGPKFAKECCE